MSPAAKPRPPAGRMKSKAAAPNVQSKTLESAADQFRNYSSELLEEIVGESEQTITAAITELKKLDPAEIVKAVGQIGEAVPIVAGAGQVLRRGLEKLKRAIEALMEMFGKDAFKEVK
jgi:CTP-dependent riboflavin kinase